jgi:hypothetical protein
MGVANWVFGRGWFGDLELYSVQHGSCHGRGSTAAKGLTFKMEKKTGCFVPVLGQAFPDANQLLTLDVEMLRL